jgi:hypothetical protein
MTWLFLVLILSTLAVACVGIAIFLRVRRHMKASNAALKETLDEIDQGRKAGKL